MSGAALGEPAATVTKVSAAMAAGGEVLEGELREARRRVDAGALDARAVEETLLQAYLFLGFPAVLEACSIWRGLGAPPPPDDGREAGPEERRAERGRRLCRRVYAGAYERLRSNVRGLHPELDRWMIEEGYGKVLSRPGLATVERELAVIALLAAAGWPRQLRSHLHGALNVGARPDEVEAALAAAEAVAGAPLEPARSAWRAVRDGREGGD